MDIIDLSPQYEATYCRCLEDWSDEMDEAGDYKTAWLGKKKAQGLRVKLARGEDGRIVGMIHTVPIEHAPVVGQDLYYVYCIWVHGYKRKGVGNQQGRGIGTRLLEAAEEDARSRGAKGIAAWGIMLPVFMRSRWFKKHGYARADRDGMMELVWKPFTADAQPPRMYKRRKTPERTGGKVAVTCFRNGWCPAQNLAVERVKRAVREHAEHIAYREIDTDDRANLEEWGMSDAIFVDAREIRVGPPPSYEKVRRIITRRVNALETTPSS